jgi:hypothetical protein
MIKKGIFGCDQCGLTLQEHSILGLFNKGHYRIIELGQGEFLLAQAGLKRESRRPDSLKIVLGNIYSDKQLAEIVGGDIDVINPVRTILAEIILEQLNEVCLINVNGLRRGQGRPLAEESWYQPGGKIGHGEVEWLDEGNVFCTNQRIVMPSDRFTFIRLDRKIVAVQAYVDGIAIQRKREAFATYFAGCYAHEAALVAAYVMAKVPAIRPVELEEKHSD